MLGHNQVVVAEVRMYRLRNQFLFEQEGAHEVNDLRHMITHQEMRSDADLNHEALDALKSRDDSFRGEVQPCSQRSVNMNRKHCAGRRCLNKHSVLMAKVGTENREMKQTLMEHQLEHEPCCCKK